MHDLDVRRALRARLQQQHKSELDTTVFVEELGVAGRVRIDAAVLNGSFVGYEIKSASDTLKRLPQQVQDYSAVLDKAAIVVASNHLEQATALVPTWWEVIEACSSPRGSIRLVQRRRASKNPELDPDVLCTFLWRQEALAELEDRGLSAGLRSKPKQALWDKLVDALSTQEMADVVRERLKARTNWRVDTSSPRRVASSPTHAISPDFQGS